MALADQTPQLAQQLGLLLKRRNWQVTCAESCTGGGIGYAITSTAGSSKWFESGYITYSNEAKQQLLGVAPEVLQEYGAVSLPVVQAMARGAAEASGAQVAVAVSGIAGPGGATADKVVGTVCFGFVVGDTEHAETVVFSGDRASVRQQSIDHALTQLIAYLGS